MTLPTLDSVVFRCDPARCHDYIGASLTPSVGSLPWASVVPMAYRPAERRLIGVPVLLQYQRDLLRPVH